MNFIKKNKIKTLKELNSFNDNKEEIQRQMDLFGFHDHVNMFIQEVDQSQLEHDRRMKKFRFKYKMMMGGLILFWVAMIVHSIIRTFKLF